MLPMALDQDAPRTTIHRQKLPLCIAFDPKLQRRLYNRLLCQRLTPLGALIYPEHVRVAFNWFSILLYLSIVAVGPCPSYLANVDVIQELQRFRHVDFEHTVLGTQQHMYNISRRYGRGIYCPLFISPTE